MKRFVLPLLTVALAAALLPAARAQYQFRNIDQPGLNSPIFFPTGINNAGVIVGGYNDASGNLFGFEYDHGTYTDVNYLGTNNSELNAINDNGGVVGDYTDSGGLRHGLIFDNGIAGPATQLDYPGAVATAPSGINNHGDIVGQYSTAGNTGTSPYSGFTRVNGVYSSFNDPGYTQTIGWGNNDAGQVVGNAQNVNAKGSITQAQAFTESGGVTTPLTIPGALDSVASDINNHGAIIGGYRTQHKGGFTGFVLDSGGSVTTFSYPGATSTYLASINDYGDIAGYYDDANHDAHGFVAYSAPTVLTYTNSSGTALRSGAFAGHSGSLHFEFNPSARAGAATVTLSNFKFTGNWSFNGANATFSDGVTYTGSLSDPTTLSFSIPNIGTTNFIDLPVTAFGDGFTYDLSENGALSGASSDFIATAIDAPLVLQDIRFTPGDNTATLVSQADGASVTATGDTPAPAPEPSQFAGLGIGLLGLAGLGWKARKRA